MLTRKLPSLSIHESDMHSVNPTNYPRTDQSDQLDDIERRLVRIETRLTKLLHHFGLRSDGNPYRTKSVCTATQRDE